MKTIAEQIKWDFKTNGELEIKDKNGNLIYWEDSDGWWVKREYDSQGDEIYLEDSDGYWEKREYDSKGNRIYLETSNGLWEKREYDSKGNRIYLENSNGVIEDNRPKPCQNKVVEIDGVKYKLVKQ
jgi:hypothetical protein